MQSASAPTSSTIAWSSVVFISRAWTTPTLPKTTVVFATSRTRKVARVSGRTTIARWLPSPKA